MGGGEQDRRALSTGHRHPGALVQLVCRKSEGLLGLVGLFGVGLPEPNRPTTIRHRADGHRPWRSAPAIEHVGFWRVALPLSFENPVLFASMTKVVPCGASMQSCDIACGLEDGPICVG